MKYFLYLEIFKNHIDNLILYDIENEIIYDFYKHHIKSYIRDIITYMENTEEYEVLITDYYSEDKVIPISKEKFEILSEIDPSEISNLDTFIIKYSLEEWII